MISLCHQTYLSSRYILEQFRSGIMPDTDDLKSLTFSELRRHGQSGYPDHVLKNYLNAAFSTCDGSDYAAQILFVFREVSGSFLEFRRDEIYAKSSSFEEWQQLLTRCSPAPFLASAIFSKWFTDFDDVDAVEALIERVNAVCRYSALPTAFFPCLEEMIEREKLIELHLHLNGTTEADRLWQDALANPEVFYLNHKDAMRNSTGVQEQFRDLFIKTPEELLDLLVLAKRLRQQMVEFLRGRPISADQVLDLLADNMQVANYIPLNGFGALHDIEWFIPLASDMTVIGKEVLFNVVSFRYLFNTRNSAFALCLHAYQLILSQFNQCVVQQLRQQGFDQFQNITWNEMRSHSEYRYYKRFRQLDGMYRPYLSMLEGRFAPKECMYSNVELVERILGDYGYYLSYHNRLRYSTEREVADQKDVNIRALLKTINVYAPSLPNDDDLVSDVAQLPSSGRPATAADHCDFSRRSYHYLTKMAYPEQYISRGTKLKLIAHFIKAEDSNDEMCRHYRLRRMNERKAHALWRMFEVRKDLKPFLAGVDAASNELHTPPEVYAPVYRMLRRKGWRNFTFHVGEDFKHLVSGIRAVYEAVIFLNLNEKCRLGHATAIGISPEIWRERMPTQVVMKAGEHLDDLVFAYFLLLDNRSCALKLHEITGKIQELFSRVYGENCPDFASLDAAWRLRYIDPLKAFGFDCQYDTLVRDEWVEWDMCDDARRDTPNAFRLFTLYHSFAVRGKTNWKYNELIQVETSFFTDEEIAHMQSKVLAEVHERGIAIETMPTSNVRISVYNTYKEHHIFRWLGLIDKPEYKDEKRPIVCIASDDPGIFATNLRNEYAHVYNTLITDYGKCHVEAIDILKRINENCRVYRFEEKPGGTSGVRHDFRDTSGVRHDFRTFGEDI